MADFSSPILQKPSQNTLETGGSLKKTCPSLPSNYVTLQQLQEKRLKEQQQQKEREEKEEEERRKQLELQHSIQTLETKAFNRPSLKIAEKRKEISAIQRGIDDQHKNIEEPKKKMGWKEKKRKSKQRGALTSRDPAESRPGIGQEAEAPMPLPEKSAGNMKIGRGIRPSSDESPQKIESKNREDRTVEIAQKIGNLSEKTVKTDGWKEADERSMSGKKRGFTGWRGKIRPTEVNLREKTESIDQGDRTVEIAQKNKDLTVVDCASAVETDGHKEADKTAERKYNPRPRGPGKLKKNYKTDRTVAIAQKIGDFSVVDCYNTVETDGRKEEDETAKNKHSQRQRGQGKLEMKYKRDRTVDIAQTKGDAGGVDCDQTAEEMDGWKEVDERSTAEKKHGFRSSREEIPGIRQCKFEKRRVDRTVEIAWKIGELRVVDCDENVETVADEREVGERSTAEKRFSYGRWGDRRDFSHRRWGDRRDFGYRGRRNPSDLVWVRKEEISDGITQTFKQ